MIRRKMNRTWQSLPRLKVETQSGQTSTLDASTSTTASVATDAAERRAARREFWQAKAGDRPGLTEEEENDRN